MLSKQEQTEMIANWKAALLRDFPALTSDDVEHIAIELTWQYMRGAQAMVKASQNMATSARVYYNGGHDE